ncbi:MAG: radical SAM domain protein [Candidatus Frackibacter sp. T328-2]|nr:MAG: radical SAM domain protein [Candidatus Frackibacter sp. T328-2]
MERQEIEKRLEKILPKVSKPTRYLGNELNAVHKEFSQDKVSVALAFPDRYEVGMSHLGIKILYHLLNRRDDIVAERVYAPWFDLEDKIREMRIPLFSLESKEAINRFDIVGFTLQYELSYTNILNMLDLAQIPLKSKDRTKEDPLVIAGGPCAVNPEPLVDFIDLIVIGEAEELIEELIDRYKEGKNREVTREQLLRGLAQIPGIYIPEFYEIDYGTTEVLGLKVENDEVPEEILKQVITDFDEVYYPTEFLVPFMDIVHDRINLEVARGCSRGCRFCQAGMIYRPVREKSQERLEELSSDLINNTGYEELSLTSLSTSDYSQAKELISNLVDDYSKLGVSISLPSLRTDSFSIELAEKVQKVRKTGLTFAPEAGTQRLRDVINKGVTEEDLLKTIQAAYDSGWQRVKLYFMLGLPTETEEDLAGIVSLAKKVAKIGKIKVNVSVSTFVPKPHTPFQWVSFNRLTEIENKINYLQKNLRGKGLSLSWNEPNLSLLEAAFARGDRRLNEVLFKAWELGCKFDSWSEHFDIELWQKAFNESGLSLDDYTYRNFDLGARLPWDHINIGVTKDYLKEEYQKALDAELTSDCRSDKCTVCGILQNLAIDECLIGGEKYSEN